MGRSRLRSRLQLARTYREFPMAIRFSTETELDNASLNTLFASAWRNYTARDFRPSLARSLVKVSAWSDEATWRTHARHASSREWACCERGCCETGRCIQTSAVCLRDCFCYALVRPSL